MQTVILAVVVLSVLAAVFGCRCVSSRTLFGHELGEVVHHLGDGDVLGACFLA